MDKINKKKLADTIVYKKYKSAEHIKDKVEKMKEMIGISNNENYILQEIKKIWLIEFDSFILENTEIYKFSEKILYVNVSDHIINNFLTVNKEKITEKINKYLDNLSDIKIENIDVKYRNKIRSNIMESLLALNTSRKENTEYDSIEEKEDFKINEIELTKEEIRKIKKNFETIEKDNPFLEQMEEIAINAFKKKKYLMSKGYKECEQCKALFLEAEMHKNICYLCFLREKERQEKEAEKILFYNPFASELEVHIKTKINLPTYYKIRDKLAEETFKNIIYFIQNTNYNINFLEKEERTYFKNKKKEEYTKLLHKFVDYKIGTKELIIKKREIKLLKNRIKKELEFINKKG